MSSSQPEIILFHYQFSPFARRLVWYLALRQIPYKECLQPIVPPRQIFLDLGIRYRRIPLLSINGIIYADTRLALAKLEALPVTGSMKPPLGATSAEGKALEYLIEKWVIETGLFGRCGSLLPADLPLLKDPKFIKDREEYSGRSWQPEARAKAAEDSLPVLQMALQSIEDTLLSDGRTWVQGGPNPSISDIALSWCFVWVMGMPGGFPSEILNETALPKTYKYLHNFVKTMKAAGVAAGKVPQVSNDEAKEILKRTAGNVLDLQKVTVEQKALAGFPGQDIKEGATITVYPTDSGFAHKDSGKLVGLTLSEVMIEVSSGTKISFPRNGYRILKN